MSTIHNRRTNRIAEARHEMDPRFAAMRQAPPPDARYLFMERLMAPPPPPRQPHDVADAKRQMAASPATQRIVSLNVLSWKSCNAKTFPSVMPLARDPAHRMHLLKSWLMDEVRRESIICLQGVGRMQLELIESFLHEQRYQLHNDWGAGGSAANDFASLVVAYPSFKLEALHIEKPKISAIQRWPSDNEVPCLVSCPRP